MDSQPAPVVVGVDGSPESREATRLGAHEARDRGTGLELVLVLPSHQPGRSRAARGIDLPAMVRSAARLTVESTADDAARHAPGIPVATRVVEGTPAEELTAATRTATLVCVGTRGSGALGGLLLGSVAAAVVRHAQCPVLVVPRHPVTAVYGRRSVVAGLDGGPGDEAVVAFAFAEAAARGTDLLVVHTWTHPFPGPGHLVLDPLVDEWTAQQREEGVLADALDGWSDRFPAVEVRSVVEKKRPVAALAAASLTAELLVVGHHRHRAGMVGSLGSVTSAILHRAACPVAVLPLPGREDDAAIPRPRAEAVTSAAARS